MTQPAKFKTSCTLLDHDRKLAKYEAEIILYLLEKSTNGQIAYLFELYKMDNDSEFRAFACEKKLDKSLFDAAKEFLTNELTNLHILCEVQGKECRVEFKRKMTKGNEVVMEILLSDTSANLMEYLLDKKADFETSTILRTPSVMTTTMGTQAKSDVANGETQTAALEKVCFSTQTSSVETNHVHSQTHQEPSIMEMYQRHSEEEIQPITTQATVEKPKEEPKKKEAMLKYSPEFLKEIGKIVTESPNTVKIRQNVVDDEKLKELGVSKDVHDAGCIYIGGMSNESGRGSRSVNGFGYNDSNQQQNSYRGRCFYNQNSFGSGSRGSFANSSNSNQSYENQGGLKRSLEEEQRWWTGYGGSEQSFRSGRGGYMTNHNQGYEDRVSSGGFEGSRGSSLYEQLPQQQDFRRSGSGNSLASRRGGRGFSGGYEQESYGRGGSSSYHESHGGRGSYTAESNGHDGLW
uniref:Uncharacterized protein n=1 Tax=Acrobeloides nanus TaxID=290746 RepID=A0A914D5P8_9BILA